MAGNKRQELAALDDVSCKKQSKTWIIAQHPRLPCPQIGHRFIRGERKFAHKGHIISSFVVLSCEGWHIGGRGRPDWPQKYPVAAVCVEFNRCQTNGLRFAPITFACHVRNGNEYRVNERCNVLGDLGKPLVLCLFALAFSSPLQTRTRWVRMPGSWVVGFSLKGLGPARGGWMGEHDDDTSWGRPGGQPRAPKKESFYPPVSWKQIELKKPSLVLQTRKKRRKPELMLTLSIILSPYRCYLWLQLRTQE